MKKPYTPPKLTTFGKPERRPVGVLLELVQFHIELTEKLSSERTDPDILLEVERRIGELHQARAWLRGRE